MKESLFLGELFLEKMQHFLSQMLKTTVCFLWVILLDMLI